MSCIATSITKMVLVVATFVLTLSAATYADPNDAPAIQAVRASPPPAIDGKLDDDCWQQASPISRFLFINSARPASFPAYGYVCYDDSFLYLAIRFEMPKGVMPLGKPRQHDEYIFGDDIAEIMLDPGSSGKNYYQFALNAYGATWDSTRQGGGVQNDTNWNGDWDSAVHIGDSYWSGELAIPFHNLDISPDMGGTWAINFCREMQRPHIEYLATAARGTFHVAKNFNAVEGLEVDFSRYLLDISSGVVRLTAAGDQPTGVFLMPVMNRSGKTQHVKIDRLGGDGLIGTETVELAPEQITRSKEDIDLKALLDSRTDTYIVETEPQTREIRVLDAKDGTILANTQLRRPWICEAIWIEVTDPWQRNTATEKSGKITLKVHTNLDEQLRKDAELVVELHNQESGHLAATKRILQPQDVTDVSISTEPLEWGAYKVRAYVNRAEAPIVEARTIATVLPGGKHHIKILNNFVSELMNLKSRGLIDSQDVEFMNPRKGWVYFSASRSQDNRTSAATLERTKTTVLRFEDGQTKIESMHHLDAGRYTLRLDGPVEQLLICSIPQLIYSADHKKFRPEIMDEALQNANTLLSLNENDPFLNDWVASGKRQITFAAAPSHKNIDGVRVVDDYVTANEYYHQLVSHPGFAHPRFSGMMVDQITVATPKQKTAIVSALARIASDKKYQGKEYTPWYEGNVVGDDTQRALLRAVVDPGWAYSFYTYLPERPTEAEARAMINESFVRKSIDCELEYPGALRKALITLGYMVSAPAGITQSIDPAVNFRVLMQLQMQALANEPSLFGVYGVLWYYSPYVDEENLRWAGRLFRHYAIEGKTAPLTNDPYQLTHLKNPDFEEGSKGWRIEPAELGSISAESMVSYGTIQNRYVGGSKGDTFLLLRQSEKRANRFSQTAQGLTPGRMYSMKMITANHTDMKEFNSNQQVHAINVMFDDVQMVGQSVTPYKSKSHKDSFSPDNPAWLNLHRFVFRANSATTNLTISDWVDEKPAGPVGRQLMFNYFELQPYLE